jgi:hypothetical protein
MSTGTSATDRWRNIIRRQQASGLSALAFCRRAGVPQSSFFAWRKRLGSGATFAEVKVPGHDGEKTAERGSVADAGGIELRLPGRRSIVVRPGFDRKTLMDLLAALERRVEETAAEEAGR